MGLFKKKNAEGPRFWRTPPTRLTDPQAVYQFGIQTITRQDHKATIATGWLLWGLVGISELQTNDFVHDGFDGWQSSSEYDPSLGREFLLDYFQRARETAFEMDGGRLARENVWTLPQDEVTPISIAYGAMCYSGSELVEVTESLGPPELAAEQSQVVFEAVVGANVAFVPPRTLSWARAVARIADLPDPWPA